MDSSSNKILHCHTKEVDNEFISSVNEYFCEDVDTLKNRFFCYVCMEGPDRIEISKPNCASNFLPLTFHCSHCRYSWVLCNLCSSDMQPNDPPKSIRRMPIAKRQDHIDEIIRKHQEMHASEEVFCTQDNEGSENEGIENLHYMNDDSDSEDRTIMQVESVHTPNYEHSSLSQIQPPDPTSQRITELKKCSILSSNDTKLDSATKELFLESLSNVGSKGTLAQTLIKRFWLKNVSCKISDEDTLYFLEVVHELLNGTRGDNERLMNVIEKCTSRYKKLLADKCAELDVLSQSVKMKDKIFGKTMAYIHGIASSDAMVMASFRLFRIEVEREFEVSRHMVSPLGTQPSLSESDSDLMVSDCH